MGTPETSREPCPDRILDDVGGAFGMGAVGGSAFHFLKGIYNSPKGERLIGATQAVRMNAGRIGGSFAVWGGLFSTFDCSMVYIRQKEDPWNSIVAGAATGGFLQMRQGLRSASRSAMFGGVLLALIEGAGIMLNKVMSAPQEAPIFVDEPMPAGMAMGGAPGVENPKMLRSFPMPASVPLSLPPFGSSFSVGAKPSSPQHFRIGLTTTPLHVAAAASSANSKTKTQKQDDDYHATLKALNSKGRFPRKSLGQHYMLNGSINELLVEAADVKEGDVVLEIGPGTGSLTNVLVNAGATVLAIEKDPYMAALVTERFATTNRVKVLEEDFTRCHIRSHLSSILDTRSSLDVNSQLAKVVANIPFNISTDVVKQLLPMGDMISEVVLLLQDEAALRLVDPSLRSTEYRPINIFITFYSDPKYKFKVPRSNFFPQPKVDAAIAAFRLKRPPEYPRVSSTKSFFSMVNSAFNGKRKMLRKSLQHICPSPEIEEALGEVGLPATSRPEELSLEDFVKLHNLIMKA